MTSFQIFDGRSEYADLAGTFCDSTVPAPFISSGNSLTVQFISDLTLEREGFNVTYTFVDSEYTEILKYYKIHAYLCTGMNVMLIIYKLNVNY
jgi:hypothetical protein